MFITKIYRLVVFRNDCENVHNNSSSYASLKNLRNIVGRITDIILIINVI